VEDGVVCQHERRAVACDFAEDGIPAVDRQAAGIDDGHAVNVANGRGRALGRNSPLFAASVPMSTCAEQHGAKPAFLLPLIG